MPSEYCFPLAVLRRTRNESNLLSLYKKKAVEINGPRVLLGSTPLIDIPIFIIECGSERSEIERNGTFVLRGCSTVSDSSDLHRTPARSGVSQNQNIVVAEALGWRFACNPWLSLHDFSREAPSISVFCNIDTFLFL
jgi:hypothetical protein